MLYNGSMDFTNSGNDRKNIRLCSENRFVKHHHTFYGRCIRDAESLGRHQFRHRNTKEDEKCIKRISYSTRIA